MAVTADLQLENLDLSDPDVFHAGPPHEIFARLRDEQPFHWCPEGVNGDGFLSVTRYDDIATINRDWETYSSARRSITIRDSAIMPREFETSMFLMMDPPEHDRHRNVVQKVFTPRAVAERMDAIRTVVDGLIDTVIEQGECDIAGIAKDLPLIIMAELLGVPRDERSKLFKWTMTFAGFDDSNMRDDPDGALTAMGEMGMYLFGLVQQRKANLTDDLLSRLIEAEFEGQGLEDHEVAGSFALLMGAGSETSGNTALGGLVLLMENPGERQKLIDDPALIPGAVEEILRFHSPLLHQARTATTDVQLGPHLLREGQKVAMWYASGNHDPAANPDPTRFDVTRESVQHQAFGGGGRHMCMGNRLARLELALFFEQILRRMPDMEIASPYRRMRSNLIHGFTSVPVAFTPGKALGG